MPTAPKIRRLRALVLLLAILAASMGDEVLLVAAVFRLSETGDALWVSALVTAQLAPLILLGPLWGSCSPGCSPPTTRASCSRWPERWR
ncbi:hypothetical protein ACWGSK_05290 [Nocardiopsis sp. NPDC055551]